MLLRVVLHRACRCSSSSSRVSRHNRVVMLSVQACSVDRVAHECAQCSRSSSQQWWQYQQWWRWRTMRSPRTKEHHFWHIPSPDFSEEAFVGMSSGGAGRDPTGVHASDTPNMSVGCDTNTSGGSSNAIVKKMKGSSTNKSRGRHNRINNSSG